MKKLIILPLLFFIIENTSGQRMNALKLSPFELGFSKFQVSYERTMPGLKQTFQISPAIFLKQGQESKEGFEIMAQYRYILNRFPKEEGGRIFLGMHSISWYSGAYALYQDYSEDFIEGIYNEATFEYSNQAFTSTNQSFEGGVLMGIQFNITERILVDFYTGGGIRKSEVNDEYRDFIEDMDLMYYDEYGVFDPQFTGVKPKFGFMVGITL